MPVAQDFSDLNARLQWLGDHQAEALKIGEAGRDWALRHLQPPSLVRMTALNVPQLLPVVAHTLTSRSLVGFHNPVD